MNKETIFGIAFWGAIIIGGLWVSGVFDDRSVKIQSDQQYTPVYSTPTPKIYVPSYDGYDNSEDEIPFSQTFRGYPCTVDCSGHEAGYEWAEERSITDSDDCGGNSQSFIEGCQSYVEENSDYSDHSF